MLELKRAKSHLSSVMCFFRLIEHENDPDIDEPYVPPEGGVLEGIADSQSSTDQMTRADTAEGQCLAT